MAYIADNAAYELNFQSNTNTGVWVINQQVFPKNSLRYKVDAVNNLVSLYSEYDWQFLKPIYYNIPLAQCYDLNGGAAIGNAAAVKLYLDTNLFTAP